MGRNPIPTLTKEELEAEFAAQSKAFNTAFQRTLATWHLLQELKNKGTTADAKTD